MKNTLIYSSTSKKLLNLYKNYLIFNLQQLSLNYLIINTPQKKKLKHF